MVKQIIKLVLKIERMRLSEDLVSIEKYGRQNGTQMKTKI